jgi:endonuclease III
MILPYARMVDFDILMDKLSKEIVSYGHLPIMNKMNSGGEYAYRILMGTVLSSRTKDEVTADATERLFTQAPNPEKLSQLSEAEIANLIYPVGFYRVKSKNIKKIARLIIERFSGKVPDTLDELTQLPGVGRKTANLVLGIAYNIESITVDTHVHRISNRIGLVQTKTPRETENDLQKILPKKYWISYNKFLVAYGQIICRPISPICSKCKISNYCKRIGVKKSR